MHRYCARPACAKASHRAAQRRWLDREKNYQTDSKADIYRVQEWRRAHPGYWRRKLGVGCYEVRGKLADAVRDLALQDLIDSHFSLLIGLVSHLAGSALQDTIALELRQFMLLGHGILTQITKPVSALPPNDASPRA